MNFSREINDFIEDFVKALKANNAAIFAGAGLSANSGLFDWKKLLTPIAAKLDLTIHDEPDLTALAQYFVSNRRNRNELSQLLFEEYNKEISISEKHRILARLPISIYWTTNYDNLIEEALSNAGKTPDVKRSQRDLSLNLPKRDAIVYKMHGDMTAAADTVLTKHEYEDYHKSREFFTYAFKSDYIARTFLFIGFSFDDPNLSYMIGRIRSVSSENNKPDYYFIRKSKDNTEYKKQFIKAESFKEYGLYPVWIDEFDDIDLILKEIESRYLRHSILISGSAEIYDPYDKKTSEEFLHKLSKALSVKGYKIVTGFGLGVGSAIINGVLDNMENNQNQNLDNYIVMRPFPQIETGGKNLKELWLEYRKRFIPLAGIAVFVFGNKRNNDGQIIVADGVIREFEIAVEAGLKVIPIGATGFASKQLWELTVANFEQYYPNSTHTPLYDLFMLLGNENDDLNRQIENVVHIVNFLNTY